MKKITLMLALLSCMVGFSQTFTDSGGPYSLQGPGGGTSSTCGTANELNLPLAVSGIGALGDVNVIESVTVNITHTWNADVRLRLISPTGEELALISSSVGGSGDNFVNCVFIDGGATLPTALTNNISGSFAPHGAGGFAALNAAAIAADGDWVLFACDNAGGDVGTINDWSITFAPAPTSETLDYYNLQWPATGDILWQNDFTVYAQLYQGGVTDTSSDPAPGVQVWIGYSTADTDPSDTGWTWLPATFNEASGSDNNDEYQVEIGSARPPGTYYYASRFRYNAGPYTYGGIQADGSYGGQWGNDNNISGVLTVSLEVPANDECDNAIALTVNDNQSCGVVTQGTTVGATNSGLEPTFNLTGTPTNDVWFSFVATSSDHRISLMNVVAVIGTSTDMGIAVFDGTGTCSALTLHGSSDPDIYNVTGLTEGNTYYVVVYGWSASTPAQVTFNICVGTPAPPPPPPANDNCATATVVVQETGIATAAEATPTAGTIESATDSGLQAELCAGFTGNANDDVWYSFVALTENVNITYQTTGIAFDMVAQLYSGECGSLTVIGCADATITTQPIIEQISATGLTPGNTYYTRVYQYGTAATEGKTFNVKIWSPDVLSIDDVNGNNTFTYHPNPVKNTLTLNAQNAIQNVSIYNMLGQEVIRIAPNNVTSVVDMSALKTGAYFIKVTVNDRVQTVRIIKQ